jgi:hypothetical protein
MKPFGILLGIILKARFCPRPASTPHNQTIGEILRKRCLSDLSHRGFYVISNSAKGDLVFVKKHV